MVAINEAWWLHLAPKAMHRHRKELDTLLRAWLRSDYGAHWLGVARHTNGLIRVSPGQAIPVFHAIKLGDRPMFVAPLQKVRPGHRSVGPTEMSSGRALADGELPIAPQIRLDVVDDPVLLDLARRGQAPLHIPGVTGIKTHLLSPEAIAEAVRAFHAAAETERRALQVERAPLERDLAEIERKLKRAQTMCLEGAIETEELKMFSAPLKTRRSEIQARLAADAAPSVIQLHPGVAEAYRRLTENLHQAIEGDDGEEIRAEPRQLIDHVDFILMEGLGKFQLEVHSSLAALLALGQARQA